ncbi:MAG: TonB-dependent receptor [Treponema sp.]|uniref:TonB-dependent receptor plug domain-containing protein n=1 Tax=Treponema sp. TaxID=166 RepID=UPI00298EC900|nr:TonB-dependent receptor plug domain-containing protein [Treponema sp.]MBR5932462.1 TonB-dependent receptor [Treponema sp.]
MKRFVLPLLFLPLAAFSQENKTPGSSYIENPRFGKSSRFQIVTATLETESDKKSQQNNPQYQKSFHHENSAVRKFNSSNIEESNTQNLPEFLRSKGFFVMTTGGTGAQSQLSYKGYTGFCIKVYIDGILANNSTTGEFDWNSIDINSIETLEIEDIPSITETEFAGCIVRITTKNGGEKLSTCLSCSGFENSVFDTWNAKISYAKEFKNANINLSGDVVFAENEFETMYSTNLYNFSRAGNLAFGWCVKFSDKLNLYGSDTLSYNKLKTGGFSLNTNLEEDFSTRNNINLSYKNLELKNELKSDTSLFYNFGNVKFVNNLSTGDIENTKFNKISVTENIKWICDFTAGVDAEFIPGDGHASHTGDAFRVSERIGAAKKFSFNGFEIEPQIIALFWQNQNSGAALLPRLTMSYKGITLSAFREFVLPTFNQLYWPDTSYAVGNIDLKPEDGWSFFAGFKRDDFPLWAQYKFSYYGNKIRWGVDSGIPGKMIPVNNGDAFYNVVTLGLSFSFFEDILLIDADATYTRARLCDTEKQIMWVPEWQAHVAITAKTGIFTFTADYAYTGKRYTDNKNDSSYPEIHMVDLGVKVKCSDTIQLYGKMNNLFDERRVYHDNYYIQSRKITVGAKFNR